MAGWLARAYQRSAGAYIALFIGLLSSVILIYAGFCEWVFARYLQLGIDDLRFLMLAGESGIVAGLVGSALLTARRETALVDWLRHRGDPERAVDAWNGLASLPMRVVVRSELVIAALGAPGFVYALVHRFDLGPAPLATLLVGMVTLQLGCGSFALILFDIFLRPIRTEIDLALPADFSPTHEGVGMARRITAELFILILAPTVLAAGALSPPGGGAGQLAKNYLVSALVTAAFSLFIGLGLVERVSGPVRHLLDGTRGVTAGDLSVRVPLVSTDEHLVLTDSFNRMVSGLREREALHSAMSAYIDPAIAQRVLAEGAHIKGEAAEVTVMFVDIVGFTALAEHAAPEQVVSDLNDFFDLVIPAVVDHGGHANKLLGDGLMAVFGVPARFADHADRALAAARTIQQRLADRYAGHLWAGVGLNSGTVVVGSMGGGTKLDYTIIGDAVNVASRVEAWTRQTGDLILLTETTRALLRDDADLEQRGSQALRGRAAPVRLWAAGVPSMAGTGGTPAQLRVAGTAR
jgi:adenylate cyclase